MPFALALVASVLIHAAALVSPAWNLPGTNEPEPVSNSRRRGRSRAA